MKPKIAVALVALVLGAASVVALGVQTGSSGTSAEPNHVATFLNPTVDGFGIDVRYASHMQANPTFTATRFCLDNGYSGVSDYSLRAAGTTATLGDGHRQLGGPQPLTAFSLIECGFATELG